MEDITKSLLEKISSYDIFNNLFPGVIFCNIVEQNTRISFSTGEIWKDLFMYYFCGMIISRIGSIFVEKILKSIKKKNKQTLEKESFLKFAAYKDYIKATVNDTFIRVISEINNVYRTIIAVFILVLTAKVYDCFIYDYIHSCGEIGNNLVFVIVCLIITILFVYSYKKQTDYIRNRVERYNNLREKDKVRRE